MPIKIPAFTAVVALSFAAAASAQTPDPSTTSTTAAPAQPTIDLQNAASPRLLVPTSGPIVLPQLTTPQTPAPVPQAQVTETDLASARVFGQWLFQGHFASSSFLGFNPDYVVSVGDVIDLKLWGAFVFAAQIPVDAQGNIFVPQVGPVHVANTRNAELNDVVKGRVKSVYREDVGVYASVSAAQPVKVFVTGYVKKPGLYPASSADSLLHFLDAAGGIDPGSGSFLDVRVLRGGETIRQVSLYDFLLSGKLPAIQFHDGDTIFVGPLKQTVLVTGLVATPTQFEFDGTFTLAQLLKMAGANIRATNVRITRNQGARRGVDYRSTSDALDQYTLQGGDEVEVLADRLIGNIIVSIDGEHEGSGQFVMPYRATLKDLLEQIKFSDRSQRDSIQLFRQSLALRQKQMLDDTLDRLQSAVLNARSGTVQEAQLRTQEAALVLQFVDRARKVVPRGQVILSNDYDPALITLEDGDTLKIPRSSSLVTVHGEVYFPTAFVYKKGLEVEDYIEQAGGLTQSGNSDRILIMRQSGEIKSTAWHGFMDATHVMAGDEILVLPKVDSKRFQLTKDLVEVLYQIAVAAGVVLKI